MGKEKERKFLIYNPPLEYKYYPKKRVKQTYLNTVNGEHRIRSMGNEYFETYKGEGNLVRDENEKSITKKEYSELFKQRITRVLHKKRYFIPTIDELTIELDIYSHDFAGFMVSEVEFKTEEHAHNFVPPSWFGIEVTNDPRFKNKNLATMTEIEIIQLFKEYEIVVPNKKGFCKRKIK